MTFLSMLGLITIISIFVFYLYVLCNLLDVAKSAWAKFFILITYENRRMLICMNQF